MLIQLSIKDFAIIDRLDLGFRAGMTVFTGETGAGKSILVDALGLLLGDRADSAVIRHGCDRAELAAVFNAAGNKALKALLDGQDIPCEEDEIQLRRIIGADGRSRAWLNGTPVTAQQLREAGEALVDIHGQHAHHALARPEVQRQILDEFGQHGPLLERVGAACRDWQESARKLAALSGGETDHAAAMELLRYQIAELEALQPGPDEYAQLNAELKRLANAGRLLETARLTVTELREEDHALSPRLQMLLGTLRELRQLDDSLGGSIELLEEAAIRLDEAADELRAYADRQDLDPGHMQELELRLSRLHDLARKHKIKPGELPERLLDLQRQLADREGAEAEVESLKARQAEALKSYREAAATLHEKRLRAAKAMAAEVTARVRQLGMRHAVFELEVNVDDGETPHPWGRDQVEYLVNINPGQGLLPLRKVASGGELSRISLAIRVCSRDRTIPCLVFDEVDAGIGGAVAEITGGMLHALASQHQVLCVTHLPQVAAQADHHLLVEKETVAKSTHTRVTELDAAARIEEIARMLGGLKITSRSRDHAREMLGRKAASG
ncbi:MAG: DNA repair protein RecN [Gammaproteobacteria bacterium]|nr:MAG: DNA repair protein RecN [Gammaproteobacteria bacterium]